MANILEQFTPSSHEIDKLSELIFLEVLNDGNINELFTFLIGQENGKKVGIVTPTLMGKSDGGCGDSYEDNPIEGSEQEWEIKRWSIRRKICYKDIEGTIAEYALRNGVNVGDLTGTALIDSVVEPLLKKGIETLIMRLAFFGNKSITSADIKGDAAVDNFNTIDGVWKRVFDGVAAGNITRTTIDANAKTTIAAQKTAIRTAGVASKIIEDLMDDAPLKLQQSEKKLIITKALWNAWRNDIRRENKGSEGQWESLFGGVRKGEIDGVTTYVVPFLDEIIQNYEVNKTNSGAYNMPYRAILTTKENNLLLGTSNKSQGVNEIDIFFDRSDDYTKIKAKDTLGAMILSNELIHVAY
jgi:hypothetical protein